MHKPKGPVKKKLLVKYFGKIPFVVVVKQQQSLKVAKYMENTGGRHTKNLIQCSLDLVTFDLRKFRFKQHSVLENFFVKILTILETY